MSVIKVCENIYSIGVLNPALRIFDIIMENALGVGIGIISQSINIVPVEGKLYRLRNAVKINKNKQNTAR